MTLAQLRYVVAVDTHRHFGKAAEACFVTQPTLSAQIQKLEDELGFQLFDRSRKPVLPTDLGERIIEQARVVLRERDRIDALIAEAEDVVAGELRLGIIPTLAPYLLPLIAEPFADAYPEVTVQVQEHTTAALLDHLAADRLDAGLIATDEQESDLHTRTLFTEPFVGYVAPDHPLAEASEIDPHQLDPADMWLLSEGHCFRDQVLHLCGQVGERKAERSIRFESGNLETLRLMVDRAGGLTLLPQLATRYMDETARSHVRPLAEPVPQRTIRMVSRRAYLKRPLLDAYVEVLQNVVTPVLSDGGPR